MVPLMGEGPICGGCADARISDTHLPLRMCCPVVSADWPQGGTKKADP